MAYEVSNREENLRKGTWLEEEDEALPIAVAHLGERHWDALAKASGLRRSGKSCRLRWLNYLRPNLKHGEITEEEELIIIQLHQQWGNKWAKIAQRLPGRTDNEIKNYWRSHLRKKLTQDQQQEQVDLVSATRDAKQDPFVQFYGGFMQSSMDVGDCTYGNISTTSDNGSSCAVSERSNMSFGQDFEVKGEVSEWCWSYDQIQRKKQSLDSCSSSCLSYPSWRFEEESDSGI